MKLLSSETASSEVVGHILILFITILGVGMITLYGVPAIYSLEDMANVKNTEQSFTVLDSRASRATLGESPLQVTNINLGGGTLTVEPNSTNKTSYMVIKSSNNTFNVTVPMGKVTYQLGDRIVAYEGGGVWSKYPSGSVMLSPPEFHYNGVTLTLPVFDISGNASVGGKGTAAVSFNRNAPVVRFPNTSYGANYTNPVNYTSTGKVYVNITSDYYDAWADFATQCIDYAKVVAIDSKNKTVSLELRVVPSTLGVPTSIPSTINFRGLNQSDTTPLENFSFNIVREGANAFNNFNWQLTATSGTKTLIFYLKKNSGNYLDLSIGYQDTGLGYPVSNSAEIWNRDAAFPIIGSTASVDLLNQSINLNYTGVDVGADNGIGVCIKIPQHDFNDTAFTWSGRIVNSTSPYNIQSLYNITQHYIWKMAQGGDFSTTQCIPSHGCGNQGPDASSTMLVNYTTTGGITYLHITDNKADVSIS